MRCTWPALGFAAVLAAALASGVPALADEAPAPGFTSELWLNVGMLSRHFDRAADFNELNLGLGGEYRLSSSTALTAGFFRNSNRRRSHYLGWYWQPLRLGPLRLGAAFGALDGYPRMWDGHWFPVAIPALSAESGRFGANLLLIPGYKDRLDGALSLQLKWRVD
jgi:hypothetical protein